MRQRLAVEEDRRAQVERELDVDAARLQGADVLPHPHARVVDEHVEPAVLGDVVRDRPAHHVVLEQVSRVERAAELLRRRFGRAGDERERVALGGQPAGEREADPARAAGDERRLHKSTVSSSAANRSCAARRRAGTCSVGTSTGSYPARMRRATDCRWTSSAPS